LVALLWLACVTENPVLVTLMHWVVSSPQLLFWTT